MRDQMLRDLCREMTSGRNGKFALSDAVSSWQNLLRLIGEDPHREGLVETPARVLESWRELFAGYKMNPAEILRVDFEAEHRQMVTLANVPFFSICEHHLLPFHGHATVAYIPNGRVVGISKLARLVECFARRAQIQERMTDQIADAIVECLSPQGVGVRVSAVHLCMVSRGARVSGATMLTTALRGALLEDPKARGEFMQCVIER